MSWHRGSIRWDIGAVTWLDVSAWEANFKFADARTIGCWVKLSDYPNRAGFFGANGGSNIHYDFATNVVGSPVHQTNLYSRWLDAGDVARLNTSPAGTLWPNRWVFVLETFSVSGMNVSLQHFVNGALVDVYVDANGYSANYGTNWHIGATNLGQLVGLMSGLFLVHRVLSVDEIRSVHFGRVRPDDLADVVAFWPMDEGEGAVARDTVNGYDGTFNGTLAWAKDHPSALRRQV